MHFQFSGTVVPLIAFLTLYSAAPAVGAEPSGAFGQLNPPSVESLEITAVDMATIAPATAATSVFLAEGVQSIATQNQCLTYSYDKNGNRQTESALIFGTAPVWGAAPYGCFTWTQP
jgi:hypothetical protein